MEFMACVAFRAVCISRVDPVWSRFAAEYSYEDTNPRCTRTGKSSLPRPVNTILKPRDQSALVFKQSSSYWRCARTDLGCSAYEEKTTRYLAVKHNQLMVRMFICFRLNISTRHQNQPLHNEGGWAIKDGWIHVFITDLLVGDRYTRYHVTW